MDKTQKTILDILLEKNRLTPTEARNLGNSFSNSDIEEKIRHYKLASSDDIANAYSELYKLPIINLKTLEIPRDVYQLIPQELVDKYKISAFAKEGSLSGGKIKIAIGEPANLKTDTESIINHLKKSKNINAEFYITTPEEILELKKRFSNFQPAKPDNGSEKNYVAFKPMDIQTVDLKKIKIPYDVITKFPQEISEKYNMLVFESPAPELIKVAVSDPYNNKVREILDFVKQKNDIDIEEYVASPAEITEAIATYYKKPEEEKPVNFAPKPTSQIQPQVLSQPTPPKVTPPVAPPPTQPPVLQPPKYPNQPQPQPNPPQQVQPHILNQEEAREQAMRQAQINAAQNQAPPTPSENNLDQFLGREINDVEDLKRVSGTGDVPRILAATVALAVVKKASDIHIELEEKDVRIRLRIDGVLRDVLRLSVQLGPALISRIKILSRLKIDEQRIPQDGRFDAQTRSHQIDLRVSTLPTVHGEKAVIRLLDKTQTIFNLGDLGFAGHNLKLIEEAIKKPFGIILATGPTGSGKSTTLYAILQEISKPDINVITLEDPVEYEIPGVNQCQVKPKIGFSFAEGLRSVLRQDPNIIMVGEIRDAETAAMSTQAALTGHLVLTTLHTNDAAGALPRLINMGIEPFLITSSINIIMAQRLVRKLCPKCKKEYKPPQELVDEISKAVEKFHLPKPFKFYQAVGCDECMQGYSGRIGICEVLKLTDKIEELAIKNRPASEIAKVGIEEGMITLKQDGLIKAIHGITTISEVFRVTAAG